VVLSVVKMMLFLWVVTLHVSPKRWYLPTSPHGVTTQKNNIVIG
jgi:hypothetical protein